MRKIVLTKKLNVVNQALFDGIKDLRFVTLEDGDQVGFDAHIEDAEAVLLSTSYKMPDDVIKRAKALKVISRTGAGVDNVDVESATGNGVMVLNTPQANSISVAEHTLALIVAISKQIIMYDGELRAGNFGIRRSGKTTDIQGKTLGLIGCGRIGRLTAEKLTAAFDMKVIGFDPYIEAIDGITLFKDIEDVFKRADYISLHIPLTPETKHMVGEKLLSLMKPTAFIINTSRGGIIDEEVLAQKLENEEIAGAALDVLAEEPPKPDNPLLKLKNIIITPHSAALSKECSARVAFEAAKGIADYLKGETPTYIVNRDILNT